MATDHIYITGLWLPAYVVVYTPLALFITWFAHRLLLRHLPLAWLRWGTVFMALGAILAAPVWDVYAIGKEAGKLCREQAGLRVYKVVEANGIRSGDTEFWLKQGFKFVEDVGRGGKKYRYILHDGTVTSEEIPEFVTHYVIQGGQNFRVIDKHFSSDSARVLDIQAGEVIGELVTVSIYPGWFDQILLGITGTGSGFTPWLCGNEPPPGRTETLVLRDLVMATIKPVNTVKKGETK